MTNVRFLKHDDGDIFAYFPDEPFDYWEKYRTCYAHIGQHSSCCPDFAKSCKQASKEEYADLLEELKSIGYDDLVIL